MLERNDERQSVADTWRRTWKASAIVAVSDSHASLLSIEAVLHAKLAGISDAPGPIGKEWDGTFAALERVAKALGALREQMMALGLHPTRPKAFQPSRSNRPVGPEPAELVDITAAVVPEVNPDNRGLTS